MMIMVAMIVKLHNDYETELVGAGEYGLCPYRLGAVLEWLNWSVPVYMDCVTIV